MELHHGFGVLTIKSFDPHLLMRSFLLMQSPRLVEMFIKPFLDHRRYDISRRFTSFTIIYNHNNRILCNGENHRVPSHLISDKRTNKKRKEKCHSEFSSLFSLDVRINSPTNCSFTHDIVTILSYDIVNTIPKFLWYSEQNPLHCNLGHSNVLQNSQHSF